MAWADDDWVLECAWGARPETVEGCAARWLATLDGLGCCDPSLATWYLATSWPPEVVPRPVEQLTALLRAHPLEDYENEEWYWLPLDNGGSAVNRDLVTLQIGSGCAPHLGGNGGFIDLPGRGPLSPTLLAPPMLVCILEAVLAAWQPAWAQVKPRRIRRAHEASVDHDGRFHASAGWLTYLAVPPSRMPAMAEVADVRRAAAGTLITAVPGLFLVDDPEHMASIKRIQAILDDAGLTQLQL